MHLRPQAPIERLSLAALLLVLASCGSSSDPAASAASDNEATTDVSIEASSSNDAGSGAEADPAKNDEGASGVEETVGGPQTAKLSLADGTVYELVVSSCATNTTDSSRLPITDGFEVAGTTEDGVFEFNILRGGFDDDPYQSGSAAADFNPEPGGQQTFYNVDIETMVYAVDGSSVSATFTLGEFGKKGIHGDSVEATLEAQC